MTERTWYDIDEYCLPEYSAGKFPQFCYGPYPGHYDLGLGQLYYYGPVSWDAIGQLNDTCDGRFEFIYHLIGGSEETELMYVGKTKDPLRRLREHAHNKPWWTNVRTVAIYVYWRVTINEAERRDIEQRSPQYNIALRQVVH